MKKLLFFLFFMGGLIFFGCSHEDNSVVSPVTQDKSVAEKPAWLKAAEDQGLTLLTLPPNTEKSLQKRTSTTKYVQYDKWSFLSISDKYKSGRQFVTILASLTIRPYSLESNQWISMGFTDDYLVTDVNVQLGPVDMSFGPNGTDFLKPALLNVVAYGLDLSAWSQDDNIQLACYNESTGRWEIVPAARIIFNVRLGYLQCVNGELSHFSRYGFVK